MKFLTYVFLGSNSRLSLLTDNFETFHHLLVTCEGCQFESLSGEFIRGYLGGRDTACFAQQPSDSERESESTSIMTKGGTKVPKIKATSFNVASANILRFSILVDFKKLASFNASKWFNERSSFNIFLKQQIELLNILRKMFYGMCQSSALSEKRFQKMIELFCEQFIVELTTAATLTSESTVHVHDARQLKLSCPISIENVPSYLVGFSDVFLTASEYLCISLQLKAMLELKRPTVLQGVDWFPVRNQVIAQLLMYQGMLKQDSELAQKRAEENDFTELHPEDSAGAERADDEVREEIPDIAQFVTKAGVFDGFGMEVFCAVAGPLTEPISSTASYISTDATAPYVYMTQRVVDASECINLLLFLLLDISIADLSTISTVIEEVAPESDILPTDDKDGGAHKDKDKEGHPVDQSLAEQVHTHDTRSSRQGGNVPAGTSTAEGAKKRRILGTLTEYHLNMPRIGAPFPVSSVSSPFPTRCVSTCQDDPVVTTAAAPAASRRAIE